jgi:hypothetical protein
MLPFTVTFVPICVISELIEDIGVTLAGLSWIKMKPRLRGTVMSITISRIAIIFLFSIIATQVR